MKHTDLMIDLETLDVRPTAHILTVGVVAFGKDTGEVDIGLHIPMVLDQGRTISPHTVKWWMEQSEEARKRAFAPDPHQGLANPGEMVHALASYINDWCTKKARVWANSPSFDLAILRNLCEQYGFQVPWHYRQERDFRTFMDGYDGPRPQNTLAHDALADAIWQAKAVIARAKVNAPQLPLV